MGEKGVNTCEKVTRREICIHHWFLKLVVSSIDKITMNELWFYISFYIVIIVKILGIHDSD